MSCDVSKVTERLKNEQRMEEYFVCLSPVMNNIVKHSVTVDKKKSPGIKNVSEWGALYIHYMFI